MVNKADLQLRTQLAGVLASIIAVAAFAVTVLADNHNAGFGHIVTRGEQMFLFVIASLLLVAQALAYLTRRAGRAGRSREPIGKQPLRVTRKSDLGGDS
jgi:hypothetical protein